MSIICAEGDMALRKLWQCIMAAGVLLACSVARQTPFPTPVAEPEQLTFDIQTPTATVLFLVDPPTPTIDPNATPTPTATATLAATVELTPTATLPPATAAPPAVAEVPTEPPPPPTITPTPQPTAAPLRGGVWSFEAGFVEWPNPHGDACPGSGLAVGWNSFTTRDQFGSSCFNQTQWAANVYVGESAQEITFAYVGVEAGIFRTFESVPGHAYRIEAFMRREFSPSEVEVTLGVDATGGANWQAETVQWFPWLENFNDEWSRTEAVVTAEAATMTVFIKGAHAYPEPGGALRLDAISITDIGPQ